MFLSHYACATADTWASEVGILSTQKPRLVVSAFFREVPPGTNGGVTVLGLFFSLLGGIFVGVCYYCLSGFKSSEVPLIIVSGISGLLGSFIDSILGGALQQTYYSTNRLCIVQGLDMADKSIIKICGTDILSNDSVNVLSILLTMIISVFIIPIIA